MAMFRFFIAFTILLALTTQVHAHAGVSPALSVSGDLTRNDVQRPSSSSPCGNVNIAKSLDSSTTVKAEANGSFAATVTNFNGFVDLFSSPRVDSCIDRLSRFIDLCTVERMVLEK